MCTPVISLKQFQKEEIRHQPITFAAAKRSVDELVRLTGEPTTQANDPPREFADRGQFLSTFEAPVSASGVFEHGRLMLASLEVSKKYVFINFDGDDDRPRPGGASRPRRAAGACASAIGAFCMIEGQTRANEAESATLIVEFIDVVNTHFSKLRVLALVQLTAAGVTKLALLVRGNEAAIAVLAGLIGVHRAGGALRRFDVDDTRAADDTLPAQSRLDRLERALVEAEHAGARRVDERYIIMLVLPAARDHTRRRERGTDLLDGILALAFDAHGLSADRRRSCGTLLGPRYAMTHALTTGDLSRFGMMSEELRSKLH